jgi:DNA-binding IclR family transcriptional regulator
MKTDSPAKTGDGAAGESMKSLRAGLRVLLAFTANQRDFSVTELAQRCELSKSQVSKILSALADAGLVTQDPVSRTYSVGLRCHVLGTRFTSYDALCQAATPAMRELLNRSGHSVRLSVLDGDLSLYLIGLEGPLFIDTGWRSGNAVPVGASSAGRVLLAFSDEERARRLLSQPVPALTIHTNRDPERLRAMVDQARFTGFSVQRDETTLGLGVASVPLFSAGQQIEGALGLAFPSHGVAPAEEPALVAELHRSARIISHRLGCAAYPFGGAETRFTTPVTNP